MFLYLDVDRASGDVAMFLGFSKKELESAGQYSEMMAKAKTLGDAMDALQKEIWAMSDDPKETK